MPTFSLPRLTGTAILALVLGVATLALPASSLAAPSGEPLPLAISPSPVIFPKTTVGYQVSREFQISNEGGEEAQIEHVGIEGPDSGSFQLGGGNCGGPLFPGQKCSVWINFVPGSAGAKQATLAIRVTGLSEEEAFEITGTAVPAQISFQPGSYDFGLQYVNSGSPGTSFQVTNAGEAAVQPGFDITGPDRKFFWTGESDCWGRWLEPGESCLMGVNFGPRESVPYAAFLRASVDGASFTAELTGEGGRPIVEADANPTEFGAATAGGTGATKTITLSNSGNLPAGFFIGVIAGGDAGSFKLLDENCSAAPLMPSGTCVAHVRFTPTSPGPKTARLAFFGETEGGAMVELHGEGVAPAATLTPFAHDFGAQERGTRSPAQVFVVHNYGTGALQLGAVSLSGADTDQFTIAGDGCTDALLGAGAECAVRVRFAPDGVGAKTATLRIGSEAAGPFTSFLSGSGELAKGATRSHAPAKRAKRRLVRGAVLSATRAHCPRGKRCGR